MTEEGRRQMLHEAEETTHPYYPGPGPVIREPSVARRMVNNTVTTAYMVASTQIAYAPWTHCYGACDPQLTFAENVDERVRSLMRTKWHPLHSAQYIWSKGNLVNLLLSSTGDRTEMSHSIEARTPVLGHYLIEYVNQLPPSIKIKYDDQSHRLTDKWVLREASKPFITREVYERKKHVSPPSISAHYGCIHLFSLLI